eukprot:scaffold354747_cov31-Attheya_sp.AAC.1
MPNPPPPPNEIQLHRRASHLRYVNDGRSCSDERFTQIVAALHRSMMRPMTTDDAKNPTQSTAAPNGARNEVALRPSHESIPREIVAFVLESTHTGTPLY